MKSGFGALIILFPILIAIIVTSVAGIYYIKKSVLEAPKTDIVTSTTSPTLSPQAQNQSVKNVQLSDLKVWPKVCEKYPDDFQVTVAYGDGKTQIARKALSNYFNTVTLVNIPSGRPFLYSEENVYAEDYIVKNLDMGNLYPGEIIKVPCQLVEDAALRARALTITQKQNLEKYGKNVEEYQVQDEIQRIIDESASKSGGLRPNVISLPGQ